MEKIDNLFISHNSKDKDVVSPIALRLADIFGIEHIFYDSWSIRPGDGIIDKMNDGLSTMTYFLFLSQGIAYKVKWLN